MLCDSRGNIFALYAAVQGQEKDQQSRCGYGIPTEIIQPLLKQLPPHGELSSPVVPSLLIEFQNVALLKFQRLPPKLRLSTEWMHKLDALGENVLQVVGVTQ